MDRLDELAIFVAIVEAGSLVSAARRLRRSPPAITRALSSLEDRIGLRLVDRTTRRLAPTEAGSALAERARAWLADYEELLVGASQAPIRGVLRITAPVQFGRRHVRRTLAERSESGSHRGGTRSRGTHRSARGFELDCAASRQRTARRRREPSVSRTARCASNTGGSSDARHDLRHGTLARAGMALRSATARLSRAAFTTPARRRCRGTAAGCAGRPRHCARTVVSGVG